MSFGSQLAVRFAEVFRKATGLHLARILSRYCWGEKKGPTVIAPLLPHLEDDPYAQRLLARHLSDEARHARLLRKRIVELGGTPDLYQPSAVNQRIFADFFRKLDSPEDRMAALLGYECNFCGLCALHARLCPDAPTARVLRILWRDEQRHIRYLQSILDRRVSTPAGKRRVREIMGEVGRLTHQREEHELDTVFAPGV